MKMKWTGAKIDIKNKETEKYGWLNKKNELCIEICEKHLPHQAWLLTRTSGSPNTVNTWDKH